MEQPTADSLDSVRCLSAQAGLSVASDASELTTCRAALFWHWKFYDGLWLVDRQGRGYEVVSATLQYPQSRVGAWLARLFDVRVRVDLTLEPTGPASLATHQREGPGR